MTTITIDELKENMLEIRRKELMEDGTEDIDEIMKEFETELFNVSTIEEIAPYFDDERFGSWDVHSMLAWCLKHCVREDDEDES